MSDELAQDDDAEDYDLESMQRRGPGNGMAPPSQENLAGTGREALRQDEVVFEIGDEDDGSDKEDNHGGRRRGEREGLMGKDRDD
jgi:hypothetical protein